jgi:hypothetical protein
MYSAEQIQKGESAATDALELVTGRTDEIRKEWANKLLRNHLKDGAPSNRLPRFLQSIIGETMSKQVKKYRKILGGLISGVLDDTFARCLLNDNLFGEYLKLSTMGTEGEGWFVRLCNLGEVDTRLFDTACQTMLLCIHVL